MKRESFIRRLVLWWIVLGVPLALALRFETSLDLFSRLHKVANLVVLAGVLPGVVLALTRQRWRMPSSWAVLLCVVAGFSTVWCFAFDGKRDLDSTFLRGAFYTALWGSSLLTVQQWIRTERDMRWTMRLLDVCGLLMSLSVIIGVVLVRFGITFGEVLRYSTGELRCFGPLGDQVAFALVFFAGLALAAGDWRRLVLHLAAIFVTATRGAVLSLFVLMVLHGLAFLTSRKFRIHGKGLLRSAAIFCIACLAGGLVLSTEVGATFLLRFTDPLGMFVDTDGAGRLITIRLAWQLFCSGPIFGFGHNFFPTWLMRQDNTLSFDSDILTAERTGVVSTVQNQLLQTGTEAGLLGIVALIIFVIRCGRMSSCLPSRCPRQLFTFVKGVSLGVVAVALGNQSASYIMDNSLTGYYLFLLAGVAEVAVMMAWRFAAQESSSGNVPRSPVGRMES